MRLLDFDDMFLLLININDKLIKTAFNIDKKVVGFIIIDIGILQRVRGT